MAKSSFVEFYSLQSQQHGHLIVLCQDGADLKAAQEMELATTFIRVRSVNQGAKWKCAMGGREFFSPVFSAAGGTAAFEFSVVISSENCFFDTVWFVR